MSELASSTLPAWLIAAFAEIDRVLPAVERAMVDAAAGVIREKCETGRYWAGYVARDVLKAMASAFSEAPSRRRQEVG